MAIDKPWSTKYPADLDTLVEMPTLFNETESYEGDTHLPSQFNASMLAIRKLQQLVGSNNLEEGSLRKAVLEPVWNYLDLNMPTGAIAPAALYQFDNTISALLDRSDNNHHLTTNDGSSPIFPTVYGKRGYQVRNSYLCANVSTALHTFGAVTVEAVLSLFTRPPERALVVAMQTSGETEPTNFLYSLRLDTSSAQLQYFAERGAGTDILFASNCAIKRPNCYYLAMTRDATGTLVNMYINGHLCSTSGILNIPTGGSDTFLTIGGPVLMKGVIFSVRLSLQELTANQIMETYRTIRGIL